VETRDHEPFSPLSLRFDAAGGKLNTHSKGAKLKRTGRRPTHRDADYIDLNMQAIGLLYDMAELQSVERATFGYKRAAKAVVGLPVQVSVLVEAGSLQDVPFIGPASARIITELVQYGESPTVESAVAASSRGQHVASKRLLRANYLSNAGMLAVHGLSLGREIMNRAEFRGDFQMHTTGSDGGETIRTMVEACRALGQSCMGVTDHSYGLPVARGMSMTAVHQQHAEIDRLNEEYRGSFRVFKGIEANILADGQLDLRPEECERFEFVVASPHSLLRRPEDQTLRLLAAIRARRVAILGHPRGRIYNSRAGVVAQWDRIFAEAAARRVAIEVDGNWHRQDLDFSLVRAALDAGCLFALDSDAHSIGELRFTDFAIAHARLAGVPSDRVINTWSDDALASWMAER
jgi:histidinol phosphatase-like PHP family hydrolase